jgi:mono/diheme cytochrome c family protein
MGKATLVVIAFVAIWSGATFQRGCHDAGVSLTHLTYWDKRDMRSTVVIEPQKTFLMLPDSLSVPVTGKERWNAANEQAERDRLDRSFSVPTPSDSVSIARGELKFKRTCVPCHGLSMKGDGPVIAKYIPPPDLLGPTTRARSDGFIYGYIRHGGAVMPSYAAQVTAQEAYDLIHYIRHMQKTQPR